MRLPPSPPNSKPNSRFSESFEKDPWKIKPTTFKLHSKSDIDQSFQSTRRKESPYFVKHSTYSVPAQGFQYPAGRGVKELGKAFETPKQTQIAFSSSSNASSESTSSGSMGSGQRLKLRQSNHPWGQQNQPSFREKKTKSTKSTNDYSSSLFSTNEVKNPLSLSTLPMEERQMIAAIKIQAMVRSALTRIRVCEQVEGLMFEMMITQEFEAEVSNKNDVSLERQEEIEALQERQRKLEDKKKELADRRKALDQRLLREESRRAEEEYLRKIEARRKEDDLNRKKQMKERAMEEERQKQIIDEAKMLKAKLELETQEEERRRKSAEEDRSRKEQLEREEKLRKELEIEEQKIQQAIELEHRRNKVLSLGTSPSRHPMGFDPERIKAILRNMNAVSDDPKLQEYGFSAIQSIIAACMNEKIRSKCVGFIFGSNGIPTFLKSLNTNPRSKVVQVNGLQVLLSCLTAQKESSIDNYETILAEGGIDVVIRAMTNFQGSANVASKGMAILQGFSRESLDFQRVIFAKGGISLILGLMQSHLGEHSIQDPAFACLRNTAIHPENRVTIAEQGGIPVILTNMEYYSRDAAIQAYGCDTLGRMASGDDKDAALLRDKVLGYSGLDIALSAMTYHMNHPGVQDRVIFLLLSLSKSEDAVSIMKSRKVLDMVENARIPNSEAALQRCRMLADALQPKSIFERVVGWK